MSPVRHPTDGAFFISCWLKIYLGLQIQLFYPAIMNGNAKFNHNIAVVINENG